MSDHDDRGPLLDMLEAARKAVGVFEAATADELERDLRTHLALLHLIVIVGEAASRVCRERQEAHPEIPWSDVIGMRNRLVHGYDQVDREIVHDTVASDLPRLIVQLRAILNGNYLNGN